MILCGICVPHSQPSIADNHCHNPRVALAELCKLLSLQKYEFSELSTCLQLKSCTLHYCSNFFFTVLHYNCRALQNSRNFYTNYSNNKIVCTLTQLFCLCKKYLLPQKSNLAALLMSWVILQHKFVVNIRNSTWPRLPGFATERNSNNTQRQHETNML